MHNRDLYHTIKNRLHLNYTIYIRIYTFNRMGEERNVYKVLVGKPEVKRPLGRPRRRWEDGIRIDLREIGLGCVDSTVSGQGPVAGCCECGDEPSGSCATELVS
jgi:hypothetical protein